MPGQGQFPDLAESPGLDRIGSRRRAGRNSTPSPGRAQLPARHGRPRGGCRACSPGAQLRRVRQSRPATASTARPPSRHPPGAPQPVERRDPAAARGRRTRTAHSGRRRADGCTAAPSSVGGGTSSSGSGPSARSGSGSGPREGSGTREAQPSPASASTPKPSSSGGPGAGDPADQRGLLLADDHQRGQDDGHHGGRPAPRPAERRGHPGPVEDVAGQDGQDRELVQQTGQRRGRRVRRPGPPPGPGHRAQQQMGRGDDGGADQAHAGPLARTAAPPGPAGRPARRRARPGDRPAGTRAPHPGGRGRHRQHRRPGANATRRPPPVGWGKAPRGRSVRRCTGGDLRTVRPSVHAGHQGHATRARSVGPIGAGRAVAPVR